MDELLKCVESLKDVRRSLHNETDSSIGVALDEVIFKFESHLREAAEKTTDLASTAREALMILSCILSCCSSVADLVARF